MSVPKPPSSLDNSCSVIHGNTLYSYSPEGFLSLPMKDGAKWNKLDMGQKVTGATCVGSTPPNDAEAGFFVVGGNADSDAYTGLQKYTYSTGNWTTITPTTLVTKNRQWHGSTYIPADDVILVYAGSQNGDRGPSSQTFTIGASAPYNARGYQSSAAPAVSPFVTTWSNADAAMMTGDGKDGQIYWFNPNAGWRYSGASLAQPMDRASGAVDAALISGDDGSKNLYTFDLSKSPNDVTRVIVQDASGNPLAKSGPITARDLSHMSAVGEKRDLTLSNWPTYNSTLAPTTTRSNFALAQGQEGTIVLSGGNAKDPISIFNANKNSWVDAAEFLGDNQVTIQDISSTTTSQTSTSTTTSSLSSSTTFSNLASATSDSSPSDLSVPPIPTGDSGSHDSGPSSNAILGITLGSIAGFLALLGLILFLFRQRKRRQGHSEAGQASGIPGDEKDTTAFAKSNLPPPSPSYFRGHQHQMSQESTSSMAILMGRVGQHKARMPSDDSARYSTDSMHKQFKSTISKPIPQVQEPPLLHAQDDRGVAFAPNVASPRPRNGPMQSDDGTRRSSGWNRYWSGGSALQILGYGASKRNTVGSEQSSRYSQSTSQIQNPRVTQDSVTVPPLNFEDRPGMQRVNSGSPVVSTYPSTIPWKDGMSGKIERPVSGISSSYSSGIPESIHDNWDPTGAGRPWGTDRASNSAYVTSGPGAKPQPLGLSKQPQLVKASTSNDMSWLNLGGGNSHV